MGENDSGSGEFPYPPELRREGDSDHVTPVVSLVNVTKDATKPGTVEPETLAQMAMDTVEPSEESSADFRANSFLSHPNAADLLRNYIQQQNYIIDRNEDPELSIKLLGFVEHAEYLLHTLPSVDEEPVEVILENEPMSEIEIATEKAVNLQLELQRLNLHIQFASVYRYKDLSAEREMVSYLQENVKAELVNAGVSEEESERILKGPENQQEPTEAEIIKIKNIEAKEEALRWNETLNERKRKIDYYKESLALARDSNDTALYTDLLAKIEHLNLDIPNIEKLINKLVNIKT